MRWAVIIALWCGVTVAAEICTESVTIDTTQYAVPAQWCGNRIDSSELADPAQLVRLPTELCYQDRGIYVLPETRAALVRMANAARADSIFLVVSSGYRSVAYQGQIILRRLRSGADIETIMASVAPPGYSQHHTGRAVDFRNNGVFGESRVYRWLKAHAGKYGFIETYPNTASSPHPWEAWHWYHGGETQPADSTREPLSQ